MQPPHLTILGLSILAALVQGDPDAPCYDPKGSLATGYYPCDPTAYITTCCPQGWTCFSNSLCVVTTHSDAFPNLTPGDVVRATCTNPLWVNNICGDFCLDDANAKGEMAACGGDRFCCGHEYENGTCNCSYGGGAFTIKPGRAQTILGVEGTSFTGSPTYASPARHQTSPTTKATSTATMKTAKTGGSSTSSRSSTSSSRTTSPTPSSSKRSTTSSPKPPFSSATSPLRSTTTPTSFTSTSTPSHTPIQTADSAIAPTTSPNKALKIGLGVGIPLAVLAVAGSIIIGCVLWSRRQKRDRGAPVGGAAGGGGGGGWSTNDDLAENERADSPVLSRPAPGMTQTRV